MLAFTPPAPNIPPERLDWALRYVARVLRGRHPDWFEEAPLCPEETAPVSPSSACSSPICSIT